MLIDIITGLLMNVPALISYGIGLLFRKRRKGCMVFYWFGTLILQALPLFGGVSGMIRNPSVWINTAQITYVVSAPVISFLFYFIMKKSSADSCPPAIPSNKPTDGSITENSTPESPVEPKKPIFERYDTYIACPGCGSLIPKGAKQCECGYDLSGPASRIGRRLRRAVPILLWILLVIAGTAIGYYAGQKSMDSEVIAQYEAGEESGYLDGFRAGLNTNSGNIKETMNENYKKVFEDAYRLALADNATGTYDRDIPWLFKFDFSSRDDIHRELAKEYGFSKYIEMPRVSSGKLVPIE